MGRRLVCFFALGLPLLSVAEEGSSDLMRIWQEPPQIEREEVTIVKKLKGERLSDAGINDQEEVSFEQSVCEDKEPCSAPLGDEDY